MTITSADLVERWGVNNNDVNRWVSAGILHPVEGGGQGNPFVFAPIDSYVVQALMAWRRATTGGGVSNIIARQLRSQLRDMPGESTSTLTVTVELAPGVTVVLELER
jgi:hypothetical protein